MPRPPFLHLPVVLAAFVVLLLVLLFLFVMVQIGAITVAYAKLGLTPGQTFMLLMASLIGSSVNLPVYKTKRLIRMGDVANMTPGGLFRYQRSPYAFDDPNLLREQVVAVNAGGCVIPVLLSAWFVSGMGLSPGLILSTALVTLICYRLARPVQGVGIGIPILIPPLATAICVLLLLPEADSARGAYVAGSIGTLLGADILHLATPRTMGALNAPILSIGGAGTFDGIFLTGIIAVLLA